MMIILFNSHILRNAKSLTAIDTLKFMPIKRTSICNGIIITAGKGGRQIPSQNTVVTNNTNKYISSVSRD